MGSVYLRQVDFHVLETDEEIFELQKMQNKHMFKNWGKRLLIAFILVAIFVAFQLGARVTIPHMFGVADTVEKLIRNSLYVFLGFNILSYLELVYENKVLFDIEKGAVAKLTVKKKMVIEVNQVIPVRIRYLTCEYNGEFVVDRVYVSGFISYSTIKEGQTIYVERRNDDGHYQYYYLA